MARHDAAASSARTGDAAVVAVRPEKFVLGKSAMPGMNALSGKLTAAAYFGDRNHIFVNVEGLDHPIAVAMPNRHRNEARSFAAGDDVVVSWSADDSLLLPPSGSWTAQ